MVVVVVMACTDGMHGVSPMHAVAMKQLHQPLTADMLLYELSQGTLLEELRVGSMIGMKTNRGLLKHLLPIKGFTIVPEISSQGGRGPELVFDLYVFMPLMDKRSVHS
eukprot:363989-Chlamydomonas_euryale.AAC.6